MVTNSLKSNRVNRKSLQLSALSDATALPIDATLPIFDAIPGLKREDDHTAGRAERVCWPAIAGQVRAYTQVDRHARRANFGV